MILLGGILMEQDHYKEGKYVIKLKNQGKLIDVIVNDTDITTFLTPDFREILDSINLNIKVRKATKKEIQEKKEKELKQFYYSRYEEVI